MNREPGVLQAPGLMLFTRGKELSILRMDLEADRYTRTKHELEMSLTIEEQSELRAGRMRIEALHMELRRSDSGQVVYSGPGEIRQEPDGRIGYVLFDSHATDRFCWDDLSVPGTWLDADRFLSLHARDWQGREWRGESIRLETSHRNGSPGFVCGGELDAVTLASERYAGVGDLLVLYIPGEGDIPYNLVTRVETDAGGRKSYLVRYNVWEVEGSDYTIRFTQLEDGLEIEARRSCGSFPLHFASRIVEALWFVLARPIDWQVCTSCNADVHQSTVRRRAEQRVTPRLRPPLEFRRVLEAAEPCGQMFIKYLDYISNYGDNRFHPTSVNIRQALLASSADIETEALALGIAVESFVRREYDGEGKPDDTEIDAIQNAIEFFQRWDGPLKLPERITNRISQMKGTSPSEAMKKLIESGVLSEPQFDSWRKIRNTTAHGAEFSAGLRQVAAWCDLTHEALLRLIFCRIGYTGPYTVRTEGRWSVTTYP